MISHSTRSLIVGALGGLAVGTMATTLAVRTRKDEPATASNSGTSQHQSLPTRPQPQQSQTQSQSQAQAQPRQTSGTPATTTRAIKPDATLSTHHLKLSQMASPTTSVILERKDFVVAYDYRTRNALWTLHHLSRNKPKDRSVSRKHSEFHEEESIPPIFRQRLESYRHSGFDRGHLVPAGDIKSSQDAHNETFSLANISPQVGDGFNRHYWARLEHWCRSTLTQHYRDVYVMSGPLFIPQRVGGSDSEGDESGKNGAWEMRYKLLGDPPNVAIPTHFFKVVYATGGPQQKPTALGAFVLPNEPIEVDEPLTKFRVPLEMLEFYAGFEVFPNVDREKQQYDDHVCLRKENIDLCKLPPPEFWKLPKTK